ncbi:hypothetical protein [Dietzia maris]|uniref:hypothetical protein n=1 Tax=Dietzia maris TaxID=37915 RepID=UPI00223A819C|nr:hypothetical protein [Dietzia maris]MCT1432683.1 hypothetical protein [Dietzia maris]MCT1520193.1 hypothetical protein [Dietzia maris]
MTPRGAPDFADRARGLLGEARAAGAAVDSAAAELFRLGGEVARAGTRAEAARSGAHVAAERDLVSGLLDELDVIARVADRLVAELDRADGGGRGAADGGRGDADGGSGPRATLVSVRRVIEAADSRGREGMWLGELATDRVRDFAEFELLYSRASQHLDRRRWDAADAVLPRLVALDRALVSTEIGAMLDELKFRLMTSRG